MKFGQSAMMVASWEGHLGIVEALFSDDADPNLQDGVSFYVASSELIIFSSQINTYYRALPNGFTAKF